MQEVFCDECDKDFKIKMKEKKHGVSIHESYFVCPHCKKKYTAFVTDPECRKMQREIAEIHKGVSVPADEFKNGQITETEYKSKIDAIHEKIDSIKQQLAPKMNQLKSKYS